MKVLIGVGIALQCLATSTINIIHASGHHIDEDNVSATCLGRPLVSMYGPLARLIPNIDTIMRDNTSGEISLLQTARVASPQSAGHGRTRASRPLLT